MNRVLKKGLAVVVAVFLLVFAGMVVVSGLGINKAHALEDFPLETKVYYFTDSEPTFGDEIYRIAKPSEVVYDRRELISEQEFEFMVYGGYFWGFSSRYMRVVVVVQLATIKPSYQTLYDLFTCINAQNCPSIFLTPDSSEYQDLPCDEVLLCTSDKYDAFLRNSVKSMCMGLGSTDFKKASDSDDSSEGHEYNGNPMQDNTTLFLDGRMADIYFAAVNGWDIRQAYMNSRTFRRLLGYMRYHVGDAENECETEIYDYLGHAYCDVILDGYGYNLGYEQLFGSQRNIGACMGLWAQMDLRDPDLLYYFWQAYTTGSSNTQYAETFGKFREEYLYIIGESYVSAFVDYYKGSNINILAHADDGTYYSLLELGDDVSEYNCKKYEFVDYEDFLSKADDENNFLPIDYLYAIGYNFLKSDFYTYLYEFQQYVKKVVTGENAGFEGLNAQDLMVFIWPIDPIVFGPDGLEIVTSEELSGYFVGSEYDYQRWLTLFLDILSRLINSL